MALLLLGVIAAVMLFGAAAVRGALRAVLAAVFLVICLVLATQVPRGFWLAILGAVIVGGALFGIFVVVVEQEREKQNLLEQARERGISGAPVKELLRVYNSSGAPAAQRYLDRLSEPDLAPTAPPTTPAPASSRRLLSNGYTD